MQIVLASNNENKLIELKTLLDIPALQWVTQGQLGIESCPEPHLTFVENALAKARHAAAMSSSSAIADDSGLCVRALGGQPGVRSARYAMDAGQNVAGTSQTQVDQANNDWLLKSMAGQIERQAHFVCVLVALRHAHDPEPLIAQAKWEGQLTTAPQGKSGFGYDPLFWIEKQNCTVAELSKTEKNAMSHRALACAKMRQLMQQQWGCS